MRSRQKVSVRSYVLSKADFLKGFTLPPNFSVNNGKSKAIPAVLIISNGAFIPAHGDCPYQPQQFASENHMQPQPDDQTDQVENPESQTYGGRHRKAWISGEKTPLYYSLKVSQRSILQDSFMHSR